MNLSKSFDIELKLSMNLKHLVFMQCQIKHRLSHKWVFPSTFSNMLRWLNMQGWEIYVHDNILVPVYSVGVEVLCRVKPKSDALLAIPNPCCIYIGLENICLPRLISKKFKVELIMLSTQRGSLPKHKYSMFMTTFSTWPTLSSMSSDKENRISKYISYLSCLSSPSKIVINTRYIPDWWMTVPSAIASNISLYTWNDVQTKDPQ